jgi:hypothetical protein
MAEANIRAGICGYTTKVTAKADEEQEVSLVITTECPNLKALEKELTQVNAYEECFEKIGEGTVYDTVRKYCRHAACPVPCGILKAIEVSAGLALPREVQIEITK